MKCKDCEYWKDYNMRVMAKISGFMGSMSRGYVELRPCKFVPSPNVRDVYYTYTDEEFECSDGKPRGGL
jgi:hypothetical protein